MISVRKEWQAIKSDEEMLEWSKKWGPLLMETYQNPIWVSGHTQGKKELLTTLDKLRAGEEVTETLEPQLEAYASAVETLNRNFKVINFYINVDQSALPNLDEDMLMKVAAEQISECLTQNLYVEHEEQENGDMKFIYHLIILND